MLGSLKLAKKKSVNRLYCLEIVSCLLPARLNADGEVGRPSHTSRAHR